MRRLIVPTPLVLARVTGAVLAETRLALDPGPVALPPSVGGGDWAAAASQAIATVETSARQAPIVSAFRITVRTVSWLTPKSAARDRRLMVPARARIAASSAVVSLRARWR
jgi:hypothetical protein